MRALLALCLVLVFANPVAAAEPKVLNPEASFPEGPLVRDGKLYYAEYGAHKVSLWDGTSNKIFWSKDGCGPSAIIPFGNGFAATCYDSGEMVQISSEGKTVGSWAKDDAGAPLVGPTTMERLTARAESILPRLVHGSLDRSSAAFCT